MFGAVEKHKDEKEAREYKLKLEENAALAKAESFSFAKNMEEGGPNRQETDSNWDLFLIHLGTNSYLVVCLLESPPSSLSANDSTQPVYVRTPIGAHSHTFAHIRS